jgi:hypothetical protein
VFRFSDATLKALANDAQSSPTLSALQRFVKTLTQGCANPGLKLANAFGVFKQTDALPNSNWTTTRKGCLSWICERG